MADPANVGAVPDQPARKKRRPQRRDQILGAALQLFHERGYHATGMDEIGAAAGITGPGIYRHFRNKEDILETLVRDRGEQVVAEIEVVTSSDLEPRAMVDALARSYVHGIVSDPSLAVVAMYERRTLSSETRAWLDKMERRNVEAWVAVLRRARPDLTDQEARVVVHGALSLGVAVCNYKSGLDDEAIARIVHPMVVAALLGEPTARDGRRSRPRAATSA
jgi:AcrR family transcriptional regulator